MVWKFLKKNRSKEPEISLEKIKPNELKNWIEKEKENLLEKEKEIFIKIEKEILRFTEEIDIKIKILEKIDIKSKKAEEKAKIIVKQSVEKYLNSIKILRNELLEIKKENLNKFVEKINLRFSDFEKHSYIFYNRANYLIGEELLELKKEINNLSECF